MKRLLLTLVALAVCTAPASASGLSLYGSWWGASDVDDFIGGGVGFGMPLGDSNFDLDIRGHYYQEGDLDNLDNVFDDNEAPNVFPNVALEALPVDLGVRYNFQPRGAFNPYVGGGASYYFLDVSVDDDDNLFGNDPDVDDEVGWYALAGSRFGDPGGANFFVEGLWRAAEATVTDNDLDDFETDEDVAIDLDGFAVNLGVVFNFR